MSSLSFKKSLSNTIFPSTKEKPLFSIIFFNSDTTSFSISRSFDKTVFVKLSILFVLSCTSFSNSFVEKIIFDGKKAIGVEVKIKNENVKLTEIAKESYKRGVPVESLRGLVR